MGRIELPDPDPFRCEVRHEGDVARVSAIGALDLATMPILDARIDALRAAGTRHLVLDLSRLEFMDSTGLRLILGVDANARADGFTFALVRGTAAVQRVFEITGTDAVLPFTDA